MRFVVESRFWMHICSLCIIIDIYSSIPGEILHVTVYQQELHKTKTEGNSFPELRCTKERRKQPQADTLLLFIAR